MKCPRCGKNSIAKILWGLPADMEFLEKKLARKEIVLGGCCVSVDDPKWQCNSCHHKWGERSND